MARITTSPFSRCAARHLAAAVLAAATACHRGAPPAGGLGPDTQGIFEYEATAINQTLRGRIVIADTLVIVEPEDDLCWRLPQMIQRDEPHYVTFACEGEPTTAAATSSYGTIRIRVSLLRPTRDSRWGRLMPVQTTFRRCVATTQQAGGTICTRYVDQRAYANGWQWGNLHVKRAYLTTPDTTGTPGARR